VNHILVTKTCDWCKKEDKAFLVFFKPKGWIKHRTLDKMDMLFCSLACFRAFSGLEILPKTSETKKPFEIAREKQVIVSPAQ